MPKLCSCKRTFISEHLWRIYNKEGEDVQDCLRIIEIILDRDCVCEKKEEVKCLCTQYLRTLKCPVHHPEWAKYLEEQEKSQSHCEHEYLQNRFFQTEEVKDIGLDGIKVYQELFFCNDCGLVTCLNPNQE